MVDHCGVSSMWCSCDRCCGPYFGVYVQQKSETLLSSLRGLKRNSLEVPSYQHTVNWNVNQIPSQADEALYEGLQNGGGAMEMTGQKGFLLHFLLGRLDRLTHQNQYCLNQAREHELMGLAFT